MNLKMVSVMSAVSSGVIEAMMMEVSGTKKLLNIFVHSFVSELVDELDCIDWLGGEGLAKSGNFVEKLELLFLGVGGGGGRLGRGDVGYGNTTFFDDKGFMFQ